MQPRFSLRSACGKPSRVWLLAAATAAGPVAAAWDARVFNPKPLPDDVILPMPCGGSMVFRRVETESGGIIGDQLIRLGDTTLNVTEGGDKKTLFMERSLEFPVSGGFRDRGGSTRYYLLGKYEITRQQYNSLVSDQCPEPLEDGPLPQAKLSWPEAVGLADRYSRWLLKNAQDSLRPDHSTIGYVRLPTEAEWEFAARGGLKVSGSAADFQARTFPMTGGLNRYVWYQGTDSVNDGKARGIGLLEPNPLGLFDILGNVDEIVLDPFHLRLRSRLQGQTGAYVVRGGNFRIAADRIRTSLSDEVPFYRGSDYRQADTTGLRFAIGSVILDEKRIKELRTQGDDIHAEPSPPPRQPETPVHGEPASSQPKARPACPTAAPTPTPVPQRISELEKRLTEMATHLDQCRRDQNPDPIGACPGPAPGLAATAMADPVTDLRDIIAHTDAPALKARLAQLSVSLTAVLETRARLTAALESRDERLDQAAREALRSAGLLCQKLKDDVNEVVSKKATLTTVFHCGTAQAQRQCKELDLDAKLRGAERILEFNRQIYADSLIRLAQNYPMEVLEQQRAFLKSELERREFKDFDWFVARAYDQTKRFHQDGEPTRDLWYKECEGIDVHKGNL